MSLPIPPTDYGAYARSHSATRAERAEQAAAQKAFEEFSNSPASGAISNVEARLAQLQKEVETLKSFIKELRGEDGIQVDGPIIRREKGNVGQGGGDGGGLGNATRVIMVCDDDTGDYIPITVVTVE